MTTQVIIEFSDRFLKAAVFDAGGPLKESFLEPLVPNFRNVPAVLSGLFQRIGRKKRLEVIAVLNRSKVTMRKVDLPSRDKAEIEQMLGLHIIKQVPYPKEEIIWGYQNLGFDGISNTRILLAIAHRDILRSIFNGFNSLNIPLDNILLSSQGAVRFAQAAVRDNLSSQQPYFLLDVDYNSSDLILVSKQQIASSVIVSFGLEQLKQEESRPKFASELEQALLGLRGELPANAPARLFLCGTAASIENLDVYLGKELNLNAQTVRSPVLKNASFSGILGFSSGQKKEDISFTLPEVQLKKEMRLKLKQLLILGISAVYIFTLLALTVFLNLSQRQTYRDRLNAKISALKEKSGPLLDIYQKVETVNKYANPEESVLNYLNELNSLCPDTITMTAFSWDGHKPEGDGAASDSRSQKGASIRGYAYQMQDIFNFVNILGNSNYFKGMQARSNRRRKVKNGEVIDFDIGLK